MDCSNYVVCTACKGDDKDSMLEEEVAPSCSDLNYLRNVVTFFVFGLVNNFAYVVFLTGAGKILGNNWSSAVLLAENLPIIAAQAIAPLFIEYMPFSIRIIIISVTATGSFLLMASVDNVIATFVGIVVASASSGFGEITYMGLSSKYHKNTVAAYSSGTGGAGVFGSASFLLMNVVAKLSTSTILYICAPVPMLMAIFYFFVLTEGDVSYNEKQLITNGVMNPDQPVAETVYLENSLDEADTPILSETPNTAVDGEDNEPLTVYKKFHLQIRLFRYTGPLFVVYFAEYMINQGAFAACLFPSDHYFTTQEYIFYQFLYQIGVFISRSSVKIIQIKALWFMSLWQVANLAIFVTTAYFNYIPSIYIIFVLVLYEGLIGGAVYANAFYLVSEEVKGTIKEFCMSSISFWYSTGILLAGALALVVQPWLVDIRERAMFIPMVITNYTNDTLAF